MHWLNAWGNLGKDWDYGRFCVIKSLEDPPKSSRLEISNRNDSCPKQFVLTFLCSRKKILSYVRTEVSMFLSNRSYRSSLRPQVPPGNLSVVHDFHLRSRQGCGDENFVDQGWLMLSQDQTKKHQTAMTQLWSNRIASTCTVFMLQTNVTWGIFVQAGLSRIVDLKFPYVKGSWIFFWWEVFATAFGGKVDLWSRVKGCCGRSSFQKILFVNGLM